MPQTVYRFGDFELDVARFELRHNDRTVKLERNPLELLILLAEHSGNLVSRPEIVERLWGKDVFVDTEHGINTAVRKIRAALGEQSEHPRFLFTVPGKGYRLALDHAVPPAVAEPVPAAPLLAPGSPEAAPAAPSVSAVTRTRVRGKLPAIAAAVALIAAAAGLAVWERRPMPQVVYTQVTNFTDAAVAPAVSPDGRTIAFIREVRPSFPIVGEVFVKRLPSSEAVQLTHDGFPKYGIAFSPDGSDVTYTVATKREWNTMAVSVLGGEPRLLLTNATGLAWLDSHRVVFSEFTGAGLHMGLATSTDTRAELRRIYLPAHERGMAHFGMPSPDRKWVLVVEMGPNGGWQPCRLVPFDGSSSGTGVGPPGSHCTSAAWSLDGKVMYFTLGTTDRNHIWRQRFPDGSPEQLTFGPGDEVGLAMAPDGRSVLTSVGTSESGLWIRDGSGERSLSSEGFAWSPSYSQDGRTLYYMLGGVASGRPSELWTLDMSSGKSRPIIEGFMMTSYDVSEDGRSVVFAARASDGRSEVWLAPADHSAEPQRLTSSGEDFPFFAFDGRVAFRAAEGNRNYLFAMQPDGSHRDKIRREPIVELAGRSFDRKWAVSMVGAEGTQPVSTVLISLVGQGEHCVSPGPSNLRWSPSGDRFYVQPAPYSAAGDWLVFPLAGGEAFPALPPGGIASIAEGASLPDASIVHAGVAQNYAVPGPSPDTFVYTKTVAHRNLFWISLR